jgi:Ca2+-binding EF-hand superfamily protein
VLKQTFEHLAARNPNDDQPGIDRRTFLRVFTLPGMLGERLFDVFDKQKKEYLTFDDFITGLTKLVRGTVDDKIKFLFDMYDLNSTGLIEKNELLTMLNSAVFASYSLLDFNSSFMNKGFMLGDANNVDKKVADDENSKLRESLKSKVDQLVKSAFEDLAPGKNALNLDEFKEWVNRNPESLEVIEAVFMRESLSGSEEKGDVNSEVQADSDALSEDKVVDSNSRSGRVQDIRSASSKPLPKARTMRAFSVGKKLDSTVRSSSADQRAKFLHGVLSAGPNTPSSDFNRSFGSSKSLAQQLGPMISVISSSAYGCLCSDTMIET